MPETPATPATDALAISGHVAAGFEPVQSAFEANFARRGEVGAAVHVTVDGETVVDLWGGLADAASMRLWTADNLVNVWSTTKGWLALAMHMLADRGLLDFDAPVAHYWPEFAQHGKESVLVKHILTHTAGLPAPSMKVPNEVLYDWEAMIHYLEQSTLFWEPGTQCGYHAATFGWLNGEVLRRITGMTAGQFLRTQIAGPLQADTFVGLSPQEAERAAHTIPPPPFGSLLMRAALAAGGKTKLWAFRNPPRPPQAVNTTRWRAAEIPSSNGHASARGLARLYTALALDGTFSGVRLLSEAGVQRACLEQVHATDVITGTPIRRSLGFMLADPGPADPRPTPAFGHPGMGGSMGFADPHSRLAFGYVMNRMALDPDDRWAELCRAVYACLEKRG
jgi:CubicO group peptidase (beta-lactamase class C family)